MGIILYIRVLKINGPGFYLKPEFSSLATFCVVCPVGGAGIEMNAALDMIPGQKDKKNPLLNINHLGSLMVTFEMWNKDK